MGDGRWAKEQRGDRDKDMDGEQGGKYVSRGYQKKKKTARTLHWCH